MKGIAFLLLLFLNISSVVGQIIEPIKWTFDSHQEGRDVALIFKASIEQDWHLYDTYLPEGGPIATQMVFNDSTLFEFDEELQKEPLPVEKYDEIFMMNLRFFSDEVTLTQNIRLKNDDPVEISGYVLFMGCDDEMCLPPNEAEFTFRFNEGATAMDTDMSDSDSNVLPAVSTSASGQTLWLFILIAALAGFAAILTPCVFPMIPMTISYFMRGNNNRKEVIRNGLFFGFSILLIFSLLGALFTVGIFGPNVGNILSTHWIPNLLFFLLFMVFATSFFGAFEIVLPNQLVNKADAKAEQGGMTGAFFMALTTVIVSFSCTGPFIGALIIEAVQDGGMRPLIGMFFFGLAFATPFTLLAIFPSALKKLPKSGGWLNSIKVVFAFILLAFGLKFLSNIDQVYGFNFISRDIFLAIWIVLFFLLGMYVLGKLKFAHDTEVQYVGVGRLYLAAGIFIFVVYLFTGLFGAPLQSISSFLPPQNNRSLYTTGIGSTGTVNENQVELCSAPKYADNLSLPHGLNGYFDYEQGLACAEEQGKPVFIVFKGHACANCKKMENSVWANSQALKILAEDYIIVALYTDDRTTLPEEEWITSELDGKVKKTMGKKFLDLLIQKYATNSIPFHVIIEPDGTEHQLGVTYKDEEFISFLKLGL